MREVEAALHQQQSTSEAPARPKGMAENCSDDTAKPIGLDELGIWELVEPLRRSRPSSLTVAWTASAQEFRQAGGERGA